MKWIVVVLALAACGKSDKSQPAKSVPDPSGQSAKEAMELMCNAEEKSGARTKPPGERTGTTAMFLVNNIVNAEVKALLHSLGDVDTSTALARVAEMAKKYGVDPCPSATEAPKP